MRMYRSMIIFLLNCLLLSQSTNNPEDINRPIDCATPNSTEEQIIQTRQIVENWLSNNRDRPEEYILSLIHI